MSAVKQSALRESKTKPLSFAVSTKAFSSGDSGWHDEQLRGSDMPAWYKISSDPSCLSGTTLLHTHIKVKNERILWHKGVLLS
jgi:hypothetical protein